MKPLTGRESSILCILASCKMTVVDEDRILSTLDGSAFRIGSAILGRTKRPSKAIQRAAEGFLEWARSLPVSEY